MRWLPQSLKLNGCSCWSPSTVSLMFCIFPYIWQFINRFLMLFPQESYALSFKVMKLHKCIYEKFLAYEWSSFDGYIKTFLHLQSSVHQNFLYHRYTLITLVNISCMIRYCTSNLTGYRYKKWSLISSSQLTEQLQSIRSCYQTKIFPNGEILQFLSQNKVYSKGRF